MFLSFKPCYKWITFNTDIMEAFELGRVKVLNLVINGLPSILKAPHLDLEDKIFGF